MATCAAGVPALQSLPRAPHPRSAWRAPPLHIHIPFFPLGPLPGSSPSLGGPSRPSEALWSSSPGRPLLGEGPQLCLVRLAQSRMRAPSPKLTHGHGMRSRLPGVMAGPERPARAVVLSAARHVPQPPGFPLSSRHQLGSETLGHVPPPLGGPALGRQQHGVPGKLSVHMGATVHAHTQEPGPTARVEASSLGGHPHCPSLVLAHGLSGSSPAPAPRGPSPGLSDDSGFVWSLDSSLPPTHPPRMPDRPSALFVSSRPSEGQTPPHPPPEAA